MSKNRKTTRYDYSKFDDENKLVLSLSDLYRTYEYYGIHPKSGRVHIDTKRFVKILKMLYHEEYIYEGMLKNRNTTYFIPKFKTDDGYMINFFRTGISSLRQDWNNEFKPLLKAIRSPKDVYEETRVNGMMTMSSVDDIDDIEENAMFTALRRSDKYNKVINSIYHQYIQKVATEIDRLIVVVLKEKGYKKYDFKFENFEVFSAGLVKGKATKKIEELDGYDYYNSLRKINNFLKHNSETSYKKLLKYYPEYVYGSEQHPTDYHYELGTYAGNWLVLPEDYIDNLFDGLLSFFEDYCKVYFNEDMEESLWNYDDYFKKIPFEIAADFLV